MVNGLISFSVNFVNQRIGAQTLRVALFTGLVGVLMVGGGQTVVAGPPDKVPQATGGGANSPIEIQIDKYGFEWCVVGDVNNPPFPGNIWSGAYEGRGVIPFVYRMTKTELTTTQYLEFVRAYWPYYDADPRSINLTGLYIFGGWNGDQMEYVILDGFEHVATTLSLRMAARYCNWLQNGKIKEQWAFETGVYDTSTFTQNEDGTFNDDYTRSPDARYWIPNEDEWMKAVYYDPNRFGRGQGGWWNYPNSSDKTPIVGYPADDGKVQFPTDAKRGYERPETNASLENRSGRGMSVGSYRWTHSPWGLLDGSGGMNEMAIPSSFGSMVGDNEIFLPFNDSAGYSTLYWIDHPVDGGAGGLRIASIAKANRIAP